jgi:signal transduction histidine kinase
LKINSFVERFYYLLLALLFFAIYGIGYSLISYDLKKRTAHHLEQKMENSFVQYKFIYNMYKKDSKTLFRQIKQNEKITDIYEDINDTNKDIQREKLLNIIKPIYAHAKRLGIKQLHFHLKNNESFLRMHKIEKYGDNLGDVRYSVFYVNKYHRMISGFEQGRVIDGFRYVYPMWNEYGKYLGSVEISISTKAFEETFENTLFVDAGFIVDKKLSIKKLFKNTLNETYTDTLESPNYVAIKNKQIINKDVQNYMGNHLKEYQEKVSVKLKTKKAFAIEIQTDNSSYIKSFIPIRNIEKKVVVAYFIVLVKSPYLYTLHKDVMKLKISLLFFVLLLVYIVHRNLAYAKALKKEIEKKTRELQASQKRVIEAEKMASLSTLVSGIAHEINTPVGLSITAISHFVDETKQLKSDYENEIMDEEEFEKYLKDSIQTADIIFKNLVHAAKLIRDFKQLSLNLNDTNLKNINLKQLMDDILLTLHHKFTKTDIDVKLLVDETLYMRVHTDILVEIFNNLILNSLTHAFKGVENPQITIEIKKKDDRMLIDYSDNGVGMDKKHLSKIFDPFYTTNRVEGNTGLGMHVVYNLVVQKLEGDIEVTSKVNEGILFNITLPIGK